MRTRMEVAFAGLVDENRNSDTPSSSRAELPAGMPRDAILSDRRTSGRPAVATRTIFSHFCAAALLPLWNVSESRRFSKPRRGSQATKTRSRSVVHSRATFHSLAYLNLHVRTHGARLLAAGLSLCLTRRASKLARRYATCATRVIVAPTRATRRRARPWAASAAGARPSAGVPPAEDFSRRGRGAPGGGGGGRRGRIIIAHDERRPLMRGRLQTVCETAGEPPPSGARRGYAGT